MKFDILKNHWLAGILGLLAIPLFYATIMALFNSTEFIVSDLEEIWPFLAIMSVGFGMQAGMFAYIRNEAGKIGMAASGGISGGAMAACCAHHATDILPIVGLSAMAGVLQEFRVPLLVLGVFSNSVGVVWMLGHIRKHGLAKSSGVWKLAMLPDWNALIAPFAVALAGIWIAYVLRMVL